MNPGKKEKLWMFVGLGLCCIGIIWFLLSIVQVFDGMAMTFGYFLGFSLAFGGLIISGVYFYRWQRIQKIFQRKDALANWSNDETHIIITPGSAYVDGELYLWDIPGTRLEDVQIERQTFLGSERSYLRIEIGEATNQRDITGSRLWHKKKLSIRIPPGQESTAQIVLDHLTGKLSNH